MSTFPGPAPVIAPGQETLPGMGPGVGERWRNVNTGTIVTVLGCRQARYSWVTLRIHGEQQEITLAAFNRTFVRI